MFTSMYYVQFVGLPNCVCGRLRQKNTSLTSCLKISKLGQHGHGNKGCNISAIEHILPCTDKLPRVHSVVSKTS